MNFLVALFLGLATLVWGGLANVPLTQDVHWTNTTTITTTTTTTASAGCGTGGPSGSLTTTSKTTSAEPSVYTIPSNYTVPGNCSVGPLQWHLYSLQAFADRETQTAHYAFQAVLLRSLDSATCHETGYASHGNLDGIDHAECKVASIIIPDNTSIPITFHFAWRSKVHNNLGKRGDLLILKSNSPGSAHACPNPPYDACWAQGLYWIPEYDIRPTDTGHRYVGPQSIPFNGTYCRTGMPECVWSEYLY